NFHDSLPTRIFLYALLRPAVGDGRFCRRRRFAEAEQIREQLIRPVGALRQLPPEVQADIQPFALAVVGLNERAGLDAAVVRKLILELHEILVARIAVAEEVQTALLHPTTPGARGDAVRLREHFMFGLENRDRR